MNPRLPLSDFSDQINTILVAPLNRQDAGETETNPYVVIHLATKLAQAGIYTAEQVRDVAGLRVAGEGNNALSAAVSLAKNDFARRYAAAIEADGNVTLNTLDLFRKDVST
ncbi:hypothetical protein [Amycolatopsis benzoatilytica]|uniref:hypothetical protein n=1 Tax=Amycolatopsis benzoatilytica TaxID=346045 RepID=UPI001B7FEFD1|nr:hypothetical protein [Amycolatopsis benzoatilytica]